jgi:CPA1 family monovalent cation:H+ antiporter
MADFPLESTVFLLVGLQVRDIWKNLEVPRGEVLTATAAVLATVILVRFAWVYPATYVARLVPRIRERDPAPPLSVPTVIAWAGMRGVITLAAAFTLPEIVHRDLLIWLAFAVIVATLVVQGLTLAPLARWLRIPGDDPKADALAYAAVHHEAIKAALLRLDEEADGAPPEVVDQLRRAAERRAHAAWEQLGPSEIETEAQAYRRLRREMLATERQVLRQARNDGRIPEHTMQEAERRLDLEESMLGTRSPLRSATPPARPGRRGT